MEWGPTAAPRSPRGPLRATGRKRALCRPRPKLSDTLRVPRENSEEDPEPSGSEKEGEGGREVPSWSHL